MVKFGLILAIFSACEPSLEHQPKLRTLEDPKNQVMGTEIYSPHPEPKPTLTRKFILRGQERYQIYCSVCHGLTGAGDGMATQRGYGAPLALDTFHENIDSLENTIAHGRGRMMGFADRIPFADRYAIAAYTQVLSLRAKFPTKLLTKEDLTHFPEGGK